MEEKNFDRKESLMKKIMEYKFYINDLALYLDTHTNDRKALALHNQYVQELTKVTNEYEESYGPLTIETVMENWEWAKNLWPWQRGWSC